LQPDRDVANIGLAGSRRARAERARHDHAGDVGHHRRRRFHRLPWMTRAGRPPPGA